MKIHFYNFLKLLIITIAILGFNQVALAQNDFSSATTKTLIPEVNKERFRSNYDCVNLMKAFEDIYFFQLDSENSEQEVGSIARFFQAIDKLNSSNTSIGNTSQSSGIMVTSNDILGCSIMTGKISLSYLSIFISYALRFLSIIAGTVSILFIIVGGYQYVIGGITESQDEAKNTIKNAIIGLIVSTSAWIIVNIILSLLTG